MPTWLIAAVALAVLVAIIVGLILYFLREDDKVNSDYAGKHTAEEIAERVNYDPPVNTDTITDYRVTQLWWRSRALDIEGEIIRDEEYWQRIIDAGHLSKAQWLERNAA